MPRAGWAWLVLLVSLVLALGFAVPPDGLRALQERVFDRVILSLPRPVAVPVVVVDIGAVDEAGLPWDRAASARLLAQVAAARPKVAGIDMVFAGDCGTAEAAALGRALASGPFVLGFLLQEGAGTPLPPPVLAVAEGAALWRAGGADGPCPALSAGATVGAIALLGDADGTVRRVPVGVALAGLGHPSLAVEVARQSLGGVALAGPGFLRLGGAVLASEGGMLRFAPSPPAVWHQRRIAAEAVLAGQALPEGAVILIGSSLPARGGLRPTAASPVAPSVQIMADAVEGLVAGRLPWRPDWAPLVEAGVVALLGLGGVLLMRRAAPAFAVAGGIAAVLLWGGAAVGTTAATGLLLDPLLPGLASGAGLLSALLARAAMAARAERVLRARMGQVLPEALVARIAAQPRLMRLEGETREVTALFTDIEGFSLATRDMGAVEMVARLDAYFALTCGIVLKHGGMIDKLVGDSVHALFNAPLDQPGHEAAALACAAELIAATEAFRAAQGGFGRTRIGVETGMALLGDVGFGSKIDYTAHGPAVNLAARLQEANKLFGTQVCIGPELAGRIGGLRPLGEAEIRSFGRLALFTL